MTPAIGWNEQDYYRASRAACKAWQKTSPQLEIAGLEEADADDGNSPVSVSSSPVPSPPGWPSSPPPSPHRARQTKGGNVTTTEMRPKGTIDDPVRRHGDLCCYKGCQKRGTMLRISTSAAVVAYCPHHHHLATALFDK